MTQETTELTSIGRTWVERSRLRLWNLLNLSVQLRRGSLVELDCLFQSSRTNGIEHTKNTDTVTVGRVFRHVKGDLHVGHGTEIVDLSRLDIGDDGDEIGGIAQISVVKKDLDSSLVTVSVNVIDTTSVEARGTTDNTMDLQSGRISRGLQNEIRKRTNDHRL